MLCFNFLNRQTSSTGPTLKFITSISQSFAFLFVVCSGYQMFLQSPTIWCITTFIIVSNIFLCAHILKQSCNSSTYKVTSGKEQKCLIGLQVRGTHHALGPKEVSQDQWRDTEFVDWALRSWGTINLLVFFPVSAAGTIHLFQCLDEAEEVQSRALFSTSGVDQHQAPTDNYFDVFQSQIVHIS